jgi:hypothetical protein
MKIASAQLLAIALLGAGILGQKPADAQPASKDVFCDRNSTISINEYPKSGIPDGYSDVQTYMLDSDFRSPKGDTPWSDTKIFDDPVTGKSVGVIDRNFTPDSHRIHTSWYRDVILAEGLEIYRYSGRRYLFDVMMIPAGDKYLVLRGCNGRFPVDQRVASALRSAPEGKKFFIKLYAKDFSGAILNEVGPNTVKSWKKVYANWSRSTTPRPEELGF